VKNAIGGDQLGILSKSPRARCIEKEENWVSVDEDELDKKRQRLALKRRERTNDEGNLTAEPDCTSAGRIFSGSWGRDD